MVFASSLCDGFVHLHFRADADRVRVMSSFLCNFKVMYEFKHNKMAKTSLGVKAQQYLSLVNFRIVMKFISTNSSFVS